MSIQPIQNSNNSLAALLNQQLQSPAYSNNGWQQCQSRPPHSSLMPQPANQAPLQQLLGIVGEAINMLAEVVSQLVSSLKEILGQQGNSSAAGEFSDFGAPITRQNSDTNPLRYFMDLGKDMFRSLSEGFLGGAVGGLAKSAGSFVKSIF